MRKESLFKKMRQANIKCQVFFENENNFLPEAVMSMKLQISRTIVLEVPKRQGPLRKKLLLIFLLIRSEEYQLFFNDYIMLLDGTKIQRFYFQKLKNDIRIECFELLFSTTSQFIKKYPLLHFEEYSNIFLVKDKGKIKIEKLTYEKGYSETVLGV